MFKRLTFWTALLAMSALIWFPRLASAAPAAWSKEYFNEKIREISQDRAAAEAILRAKDQATWTDSEIMTYLGTATFTISYACKMYIDVNGIQPVDSEALRNSGLIQTSDWPGNPYNNWEPMEWSTDPSIFSPGNMYFQSCPSDYYSGLDKSVAKTFSLCTYGPSDKFIPGSPVMKHFDWATIPPGTACNVWSKWSTTAEQKARKEKSEKNK